MAIRNSVDETVTASTRGIARKRWGAVGSSVARTTVCSADGARSTSRAGRVDVDDSPVLDDRHAVAESLGLFHQVRCQKHRLAALAYAPAIMIPRSRDASGGRVP